MRAHEGAGAARRFLAVGKQDTRLANKDPALALIQRPSAITGPVFMGRVKTRLKAVVRRKRSLTRRVAGIESRIVHHLEIKRAMRRACGMEAGSATSKRMGETGLDDFDSNGTDR